MMHYYNGAWSGGSFIAFHVIGFLLFLFLIILVLRFCWGSHFYHHNHFNKNNETDSNEILKQRYAKGEITKEEYNQIKKDIS